MTDQQMMTAIINAIQTDSNLILLIRTGVIKAIMAADTQMLQNAMVALNLPTS